MNLNRIFPWWRAAPARAAHRPAPPDWVNAGSEPGPQQLDDVLLGCGWFDSSHELHTGLQVTEHPDAGAGGQRGTAGLVAGLAVRRYACGNAAAYAVTGATA